ncbi:hypothetical protein AOQ84DRAFT_368356 [Glonium stellatum]|uniref:Uncharacterized protein n=1 Tax=Glonium stellatum TaxID=574774 RepID=A0A8E2ERA6_9PEZI|nr:hypothetical protein AOQ84DRAFT_368356 [Glonium stellatum]
MGKSNKHSFKNARSEPPRHSDRKTQRRRLVIPGIPNALSKGSRASGISGQHDRCPAAPKERIRLYDLSEAHQAVLTRSGVKAQTFRDICDGLTNRFSTSYYRLLRDFNTRRTIAFPPTQVGYHVDLSILRRNYLHYSILYNEWSVNHPIPHQAQHLEQVQPLEDVIARQANLQERFFHAEYTPRYSTHAVVQRKHSRLSTPALSCGDHVSKIAEDGSNLWGGEHLRRWKQRGGRNKEWRLCGYINVTRKQPNRLIKANWANQAVVTKAWVCSPYRTPLNVVRNILQQKVLKYPSREPLTQKNCKLLKSMSWKAEDGSYDDNRVEERYETSNNASEEVFFSPFQGHQCKADPLISPNPTLSIPYEHFINAVLGGRFRLKGYLREESHGDVYAVEDLSFTGNKYEAKAYTLRGVSKTVYRYRIRNLKRLSSKSSFICSIDQNGEKYIVNQVEPGSNSVSFCTIGCADGARSNKHKRIVRPDSPEFDREFPLLPNSRQARDLPAVHSLPPLKWNSALHMRRRHPVWHVRFHGPSSRIRSIRYHYHSSRTAKDYHTSTKVVHIEFAMELTSPIGDNIGVQFHGFPIRSTRYHYHALSPGMWEYHTTTLTPIVEDVGDMRSAVKSSPNSESTLKEPTPITFAKILSSKGTGEQYNEYGVWGGQPGHYYRLPSGELGYTTKQIQGAEVLRVFPGPIDKTQFPLCKRQKTQAQQERARVRQQKARIWKRELKRSE